MRGSILRNGMNHTNVNELQNTQEAFIIMMSRVSNAHSGDIVCVGFSFTVIFSISFPTKKESIS